MESRVSSQIKIHTIPDHTQFIQNAHILLKYY